MVQQKAHSIGWIKGKLMLSSTSRQVVSHSLTTNIKMSKYAKNSWKMSKRTGGSISSGETNKSSIEDDIPTNPSVLADDESVEIADPCLEFAKRKVCTAGEKCKLDHQRKLCRSFLVRGECSLQANGRKCHFGHFQEMCGEFQRRGECSFERRTGRECFKRHQRALLYKKGVKIA